MAELNQPATGQRKTRSKGQKTKKLSTRVDLTPMVDLGFLLITFFIFTTSMTKPVVIKTMLPKEVPDNLRDKTPLSGALTIIPGSKDEIYYYEGDDPKNMSVVTTAGIRSVIINKKLRTDAAGLMIIIKPNKESSFKNIIDLLDEMRINNVTRYALVDITPAENLALDVLKK